MKQPNPITIRMFGPHKVTFRATNIRRPEMERLHEWLGRAITWEEEQWWKKEDKKNSRARLGAERTEGET